MKSILVCVLLFCLIGSITFVAGQERGREERSAAQAGDKSSKSGDQIEVKTDRFSNETTLVLKPQILIDKPDHFVTITIKTTVGGESTDLRKVPVYSFVQVDSQSRNPLDYGDNQLRFLVDDKPFDITNDTFSEIPSETKYYIEKTNLPRRRSYSASFYLESPFERLSKANKIEMRLGPFETALSQPVIANLREYANQVLAQYKIAKERKQ